MRETTDTLERDAAQLAGELARAGERLASAKASIGRVITAPSVRRTGAGRELMREAIQRAEELWPRQPIRIGAQAHLERFYGEFGFEKASEPYIEDGIPHIEMLRPTRTTTKGVAA